MKGYTSKEVSRMLDMPVGQVRSYARAGVIQPERGSRGEYRFKFQDLVLLRTAKGLTSDRITQRRVKDALQRLRRQLPGDRPLSGVAIAAEGEEIVVRESGRIWSPESGQTQFVFEPLRVSAPAARPARPAGEPLRRDSQLNAEEWFRLGAELEAGAPDEARESYRRALELDPEHTDARINLGRLLHEAGQLEAAESHYRLALGDRPDDSTALFNLGVVLEDLERRDEAIAIYRRTVEVDPECADAFYNLARLFEKAGDSKNALRCLKSYRRLTE